MRKINILRKPARLAFLFLMGAGLAVADEVDLSFEKIPEIISNQNISLKANRMFIEAAATQSGYMKRSFYPRAEVMAGYEAFETGPFSRKDQPYGKLEVTSNLYRGGRDQSEEAFRQTRAALAEAEAERAYRDHLNMSRQYYWDLVHVREMIQLIETALKKNKSIRTTAVQRIQRGLAAETDRLEFDMVGARLKESLQSYKHERILIEASLAPYLGYSVGTQFKTPDAIPTVDIKSFTDMDTAKPNPDLLIIHAQESEAKLKTSLHRSWWKPSLDLYGGYYLYTFRDREYVDRDDRKDVAVGGRVSMFLFDGGQSKRESRVSSKKASALRAQKQYEKNRIDSNTFRLMEDLKHELELVQSSKDQLELVNKYLEATIREYKRGVKNSPDVVGALEKLYKMETQYAERRRNAQQIRSDIMKVRGE